MKPSFSFVVLVLLASGCAGTPGNTPPVRPDPRPGGTEVGTSFPGVNQPTTTTTATHSNDTSH